MSNAPCRPRVGVVVGKLNPPHLGHLALIEFAGEHCRERVHVIVCERDGDVVEAALRARWMSFSLPDELTKSEKVHFHVTPDDIPEEPEPWARRTLELLAEDPPDAAFTSEDYGEPWAAAMDIRHVSFDPDRRRVATSATAIRRDPVGRYGDLVPAARAGLVRTVVLVGAESTGKTTLARDLAVALGTRWVPEYGRLYWDERPDTSPTLDEFAHIASIQQELIELHAREVSVPWLIADTDALVTEVWAERYLGEKVDRLSSPGSAGRAALRILCGDEIPWIQDGTRESRAQRSAMQRATVERLKHSDMPWVEVTGSRKQRLNRALAAVRQHSPPPVLHQRLDGMASMFPPPRPEVVDISARLERMVAAADATKDTPPATSPAEVRA